MTGIADAFSGTSSFYNEGIGKIYTVCCKQVNKLHIILVTGLVYQMPSVATHHFTLKVFVKHTQCVVSKLTSYT